MTVIGFPHSDIHGSILACSSPWLFAAYRVLRRLLAPRHPPYALSSLTYRLYKYPYTLLSVRASLNVAVLLFRFRPPVASYTIISIRLLF